MRNRTSLSVIILGCLVVQATPSSAAIREIFSIDAGASHIYRVELDTSTVTDLGAGGVGFITNLAMSPDRTLYYMNPFEGGGGGHDLYKATLNGTNTALVGAPTFVKHLPTIGFGIIDGFTVGPDSKLYMTGYGKSEIYRYDVVLDVFQTAVVLTGGGEFRSDLAFDPSTGNLVGLGIEPGTSDRTLFEIPGITATTGISAAYTWSYYGGGGSAWSTKVLNSGTELGGNPDGIAFDRTNGDLYMSGDGTGIYAYNRVTAVRGALIPGTGDGFLHGLGFDLAFQTLEKPLNGVPEPSTLVLGLGLAATAIRLTRRRSLAAAS